MKKIDILVEPIISFDDKLYTVLKDLFTNTLLSLDDKKERFLTIMDKFNRQKLVNNEFILDKSFMTFFINSIKFELSDTNKVRIDHGYIDNTLKFVNGKFYFNVLNSDIDTYTMEVSTAYLCYLYIHYNDKIKRIEPDYNINNIVIRCYDDNNLLCIIKITKTLLYIENINFPDDYIDFYSSSNLEYKTIEDITGGSLDYFIDKDVSILLSYYNMLYRELLKSKLNPVLEEKEICNTFGNIVTFTDSPTLTTKEHQQYMLCLSTASVVRIRENTYRVYMNENDGKRYKKLGESLIEPIL